MPKRPSKYTLQLDLTPDEHGFWLLLQSNGRISFTIDYFAIGTGGHQQQGNLSDSMGAGIFRFYVKLHFPVIRVGITNLQFQDDIRTAKAQTAFSRSRSLIQASVDSATGSNFPPLMEHGATFQIPKGRVLRKPVDMRKRPRHWGPYADQYDMYGFGQYGVGQYGFGQYGFGQYGFGQYGLKGDDGRSEGSKGKKTPKLNGKLSGSKKTHATEPTRPSKPEKSSSKRGKREVVGRKRGAKK
jgi:hypothetical protein